MRAGADGEVNVVELDDLSVTSIELDDAPAQDDTRTDIWVDGNDESSQPREINGITLNIAQVPVNLGHRSCCPALRGCGRGPWPR